MGRGQLSEDKEQCEAFQFFLRILSAAKEWGAQKEESLQEALRQPESPLLLTTACEKGGLFE